MKDNEIKEIVKKGYAKVAKQETSCCSAVNSCCGKDKYAEKISENIGYSKEDIASVPDGANLGLGCGNPIAFASLKEGETVLDLGSGAGFDCFIAAKKVGKNGKVIGVDMTQEMVEKARENARRGNYKNVAFKLGEIESLPIESNSVNIIISNCVINLSPDKNKVFNEAFRVLKTGGRVMVSDIVLLKELSGDIKNSIEGYIGCLSGAMMKEDYIDTIKKAGFQEVKILEETFFPVDFLLNDPTVQTIMKNLNMDKEEMKNIANSAVSIKVYGTKP